ncbi:MAG: helix-turn-helix domain-containing protein [Acidimicrobiales bacterium]
MPKETTIDGDMNLEDLQAELAGTNPALRGAVAAAESRQQEWHDGYHARLAEVRKVRPGSWTQVTLARKMHISQPSVAEMERKADMLLSTLRGYIEAMGGELRLVANFPDVPSEVTIDLAPSPSPRPETAAS